MQNSFYAHDVTFKEHHSKAAFLRQYVSFSVVFFNTVSLMRSQDPWP